MLQYTDFDFVDCANCGTHFGLQKSLNARRTQDGKIFYCPNGHQNVYRQDNAKDEKGAMQDKPPAPPPAAHLEKLDKPTWYKDVGTENRPKKPNA